MKFALLSVALLAASAPAVTAEEVRKNKFALKGSELGDVLGALPILRNGDWCKKDSDCESGAICDEQRLNVPKGSKGCCVFRDDEEETTVEPEEVYAHRVSFLRGGQDYCKKDRDCPLTGQTCTRSSSLCAHPPQGKGCCVFTEDEDTAEEVFEDQLPFVEGGQDYCKKDRDCPLTGQTCTRSSSLCAHPPQGEGCCVFTEVEDTS